MKNPERTRRHVKAMQSFERQAEREYYDVLVAQGRTDEIQAIFGGKRP